MQKCEMMEISCMKMSRYIQAEKLINCEIKEKGSRLTPAQDMFLQSMHIYIPRESLDRAGRTDIREDNGPDRRISGSRFDIRGIRETGRIEVLDNG